MGIEFIWKCIDFEMFMPSFLKINLFFIVAPWFSCYSKIWKFTLKCLIRYSFSIFFYKPHVETSGFPETLSIPYATLVMVPDGSQTYSVTTTVALCARQRSGVTALALWMRQLRLGDGGCKYYRCLFFPLIGGKLTQILIWSIYLCRPHTGASVPSETLS